MSYGYIYKTTNLANGRIYIGQKRGTFDPDYFGSGDLIRYAVKKYGKQGFLVEQIAWATSSAELDQKEIEIIAQYRASLGDDNMYNIANGGRTVMAGRSHSEETRRKISERAIGRPSWNKGVSCRPETREKLRLANLGKKASEETKSKMSASRLGKPTGLAGRPRSLEARLKTSETVRSNGGAWNKGRPWSEEIKQRISLGRRGLIER